MNSCLEKAQGIFLKTLEGEETLREEWNRLVLEMEVPQVFFTYEWALALERSFQSSTQPLIFILRQGQELTGVAALACRPSDAEEAFFLGASTADYCDIVSAPRNRSLVVMELLRALRCSQVRKISLTCIPSDSATIEALSRARSCGYWSYSRAAYLCSRIVFKRESHGLPPKGAMTSRSKGKLKRLSKIGPAKLIHLRARDEAFAALDSIVKAQVSRFLATLRASPLLLQERRRFLGELMNLLSQQNWLDVSVLKLGEREIAWNLGFRFEGISFWYLPTYDISMDSLSPGACLLELMTEEGWTEQSLKEIDLGLGDEAYKARIANDSRATRFFVLSSGMVAHAKILGREALTRLAKASRSFEKFVRSLSRHVNWARGAIQRHGVSKATGMFWMKALAKVFWRDEIVFFEWPGGETHERQGEGVLKKMDWEILAQSALHNCEDTATIEYLKRSAHRLKNNYDKRFQGYVLTSETGIALHYCWIADFSGFELEEIQHKLPTVSNAKMIFDCWTPGALRGKHYYGTALESVAQELYKRGEAGWIFSSKQNGASLNALKRSSFVPRYSIVRRKLFFRMPAEKSPEIGAEN